MKSFKPLNFLYNFLIAFVVLGMLFGATPAIAVVSFGTAFVSGTVLSFVPKIGLAMAIQVEIWQDHIEQEIFKDNSFLRKSVNADQYVLNGKVVHIPQSGGSGNVVKNRTSLPANVRKRTDTDVIYLLDEFTTDPVLIPNADNHELSYGKRNSVLGEDRDKLNQVIAEEGIYNWLHSPAYGTYSASVIPTANILSTSGSDVIASAPSATGNRKATTLTDLQKMYSYFRSRNMWYEGKMNALFTAEMLIQMFPADSSITATYMQNVSEAERRQGIMYKAQGWNIMCRSSVAVVASDGSIKAPSALGAATDDEAALFWYEGAVEFGFGGVEAFEKERDPQFYGDVYSFLARAGGRARRADYKGIALLKQAKA